MPPQAFMADNHKPLLIDDNPMALGMLPHALPSLAQVTTAASDAVDARQGDIAERLSTQDAAERRSGKTVLFERCHPPREGHR